MERVWLLGARGDVRPVGPCLGGDRLDGQALWVQVGRWDVALQALDMCHVALLGASCVRRSRARACAEAQPGDRAGLAEHVAEGPKLAGLHVGPMKAVAWGRVDWKTFD